MRALPAGEVPRASGKDWSRKTTKCLENHRVGNSRRPSSEDGPQPGPINTPKDSYRYGAITCSLPDGFYVSRMSHSSGTTRADEHREGALATASRSSSENWRSNRREQSRGSFTRFTRFSWFAGMVPNYRSFPALRALKTAAGVVLSCGRSPGTL